ncbi:hypothetical protein DMUE_6296, partial [Dictyocoela muelleri]
NKKFNILHNTIFIDSRLEIHVLLRVIYCFIGNFDGIQTQLVSEISKTTIINIRQKIVGEIKDKKAFLFQKIGGPGIRVQIDETAICRGKIILNPSNTLDDMEGIQWLVGGIEETIQRKFFLVIVPNRQSSTILDLLRRNVNEGSVIITDGYPSYPSAVNDFNSLHLIVSHSEGFVNYQGDHTNLIENLWSHFKIEYRSRRGIVVCRMEDFVYEFYFKKTYLKERNVLEISNCFLMIVKLLL